MKRTDPREVTSAELLSLPVRERLTKMSWVGQLWTAPDGTPVLPVEFVGRQGRAVQLIGVPVFDVVFKSQREFTVRAAGVVE